MAKVDMNLLYHDILLWAKHRGLDNGNSDRQLIKLMEEVGETAECHNKKDINGFMDGIGDIFVVLSILCKQKGISFPECIFATYDEIKDRTGTMVDGVYIKKEDWNNG